MNLFKKGNIYWMDYRDAHGGRHRESTGTDNLKLAERVKSKKVEQIIEEKKLGIKPVRNILLSKYIKDYLEYSKANKKPKSTELDKMALGKLEEFIDNKKITLDEINDEVLEKYKIHRLGQVSRSTVKREFNSIRNFFSRAQSKNKIRNNPAEKVEKIKEPPGRVRYLNHNELHALLEAAKKLDYLYLFVVIALNTGMRKNEILGLKWSDIDFENGFIHLEDSKSGERADIIMNPAVIEAFKNYPQKSERVFTVKDPKKAFKGALKTAGIKNFRIHDLRHTFASHLAMQGVSLVVLKELMRHKDIKMTLKYAHLSPLHRAEAVNALSGRYQELQEKAKAEKAKKEKEAKEKAAREKAAKEAEAKKNKPQEKEKVEEKS